MVKKLKPLEIYKLLPKTNCRECGENSCMAFAAKLVEREKDISYCKPLFKDPKYRKNLEKLLEILRPPVKDVVIGVKPHEIKIGGKDVVYRHERTWRNPTALAIDVSDTMPLEEIESRVELVNKFYYERIGRKLTLDMVAIRNAGDNEKFIKVVKKVSELTDKPLMLCTLNAKLMEKALKVVSDRRPLIYAATIDNWRDMTSLAIKYKCPLVVSAPGDLNKLKSLAGTLRRKLRFEDIVLDPGTFPADVGIAETLSTFTLIRYSAIYYDDLDLGFPLLAIPASVWLSPEPNINLTKAKEIVYASMLISRYADIMVLHTIDSWALIALLTLRDCLYTDPRIPPSVKPGLYKVGEPDDSAPLIVTSNYALTFSLVKGDLEKGKINAWLLVIDTEGTSVESAVAGRKFTADKIAEAIKEYELDKKVRHKSVIIPGKAARIAGELEDLLKDWRVFIGPRESSDLPKYIKNVWLKEVYKQL